MMVVVVTMSDVFSVLLRSVQSSMFSTCNEKENSLIRPCTNRDVAPVSVACHRRAWGVGL